MHVFFYTNFEWKLRPRRYFPQNDGPRDVQSNRQDRQILSVIELLTTAKIPNKMELDKRLQPKSCTTVLISGNILGFMVSRKVPLGCDPINWDWQRVGAQFTFRPKIMKNGGDSSGFDFFGLLTSTGFVINCFAWYSWGAMLNLKYCWLPRSIYCAK